jgi:RNA polymerase Rpb2, domain 6
VRDPVLNRKLHLFVGQQWNDGVIYLPFRCVEQVAALVGKEGDATPFTTVTVENISTALHKCGYQSRGWEVMYNGHTGRRLQVCTRRFPSCAQR